MSGNLATGIGGACELKSHHHTTLKKGRCVLQDEGDDGVAHGGLGDDVRRGLCRRTTPVTGSRAGGRAWSMWRSVGDTRIGR